jgi:hypothetical protein
MPHFVGFVVQEQTLNAPILTKNMSTGAPQDGDGGIAPTVRVYGPAGLMPNGSLTATIKDSGPAGGVITNATNTNPIQITSANHGLASGTRVTISGVLTNTNANGTFTITVIDANTFSLNGVAGNGAYGGGGLWHVAGLYNVAIACLGANGYLAGTTYAAVWYATVNGAGVGDLFTFTVA